MNGVIILSGTFDGTGLTTLMNCLVSEDLDNEIIVSWFDAQRVGALNMYGVNLDKLSLCHRLSQSYSNAEYYMRCELNLIYQVTERCSLNPFSTNVFSNIFVPGVCAFPHTPKKNYHKSID